MAQKAFVSYLRSVHLQPDKQIFDVNKLPVELLASSWGLPTMPRLRFVAAPAVKKKNIPYALREEGKKEEGKEEEEEEEEEKEEEEGQEEKSTRTRVIATVQPDSKFTKMFNRKNHDVLSDSYRRMVAQEEQEQEQGADSDDEIFKVSENPKYLHMAEVAAEEEEVKPRVSKRSMKKIRVNGGNGSRIVFDEETGEALDAIAYMGRKGTGKDGLDDDVTPEAHAEQLRVSESS
eukprot:763185-Hanusia_phi.AAC.1